MRDYRYAVSLEDDPDGGFIATFPDVPEAITFGGDRAEALRSASEGLGLALRGYLADDRTIPAATATGADLVAPYADEVMKLGFVEAFRASGMTVEAFRVRSGRKPWEIEALLDPDKLNDVWELEDALALLGHRLRVEVEAA